MQAGESEMETVTSVLGDAMTVVLIIGNISMAFLFWYVGKLNRQLLKEIQHKKEAHNARAALLHQQEHS